MGRVEQSKRLEAPEAPSPFKSVRSIQIGPFWYKKELSGKSYLLNSHVTLLALLEGVCSKIDIRERISGRPLGGGHTKVLNPRELKGGVRRRSENVFRKKVSGKKKYVRGKRDHSAPGRTVWVVRTGRRGWEEVERVCSDRHETCT